jgi:hypothetical protein
LEDILNLEAGLEEADRNRVMDATSEHHQHQTLPPEVKLIFSDKNNKNKTTKTKWNLGLTKVPLCQFHLIQCVVCCFLSRRWI